MEEIRLAGSGLASDLYDGIRVLFDEKMAGPDEKNLDAGFVSH